MSKSFFTLPIKCVDCERVGSSFWQKEKETAGASSLVGVGNGFYERVRKKNRSLTEVVCGACETVQPNLVRAC